MKRFHIAIILLICCTAINISAQRKNTGGRSTTRTTNSNNANTNNKTQELQVPEGLYSVEELERKREDALDEIAVTSQLLKEASVSAKTSLNRLNLLSQQLLARKKVISLLGEEIAAIDRRMKTMNDEIDILEKDLNKKKENYAKSMQTQQQEHRTSQFKMLLILSAEDLAQSYRRMRYLQEYSKWQKEEAERIVTKQSEITRRKTELEKSKEEKQTLLSQRNNENKKLEDEQKQQQTEVKDLNKKQRELQNLLQQKRKEADALNKQIDNLIAEEIKKSEKNAASQSGNAATAESSSKSASTRPASGSSYVLTESEATISKNFSANKGKLPYPLSGKYTIVSRYGEHQHQELTHVRTVNNGIDIQTTAGSEARAIYKGVITRIFVMPGFNNNVIVRHGDYLTVYSNLSEVYVKAGDAVNTGQAIGKIYSDSEKGNETILHFQLWHERTKLNPAVWIK